MNKVKVGDVVMVKGIGYGKGIMLVEVSRIEDSHYFMGLILDYEAEYSHGFEVNRAIDNEGLCFWPMEVISIVERA